MRQALGQATVEKNPIALNDRVNDGMVLFTFNLAELRRVQYRRALLGFSICCHHYLKWVGTAVVFIAVYAYWRLLPQPHSF